MFFVFLRWITGFVFLVSGIEKLVSPPENFLYIVRSYQILPGWLAGPVSFLFPWVEFFAAVFLILGFWLRTALWVALCLAAGFVFFVSQALFRGLSISDCGCFGELIHLQPRQVIILDLLILVGAGLCLRRLNQSARWSLDACYARNK
jgi:uncharacterized membrane protein YphA (DoxX/SURF4 family)